MKKVLILFFIAVTAFSCTEEEELTGNLVAEIQLGGLAASTTYALFTEAAYLSEKYIPLEEGEINGRLSIEFKNLLPGTYVFVVYSANPLPFTGQVVAGETNKLRAAF